MGGVKKEITFANTEYRCRTETNVFLYAYT